MSRESIKPPLHLPPLRGSKPSLDPRLIRTSSAKWPACVAPGEICRTTRSGSTPPRCDSNARCGVAPLTPPSSVVRIPMGQTRDPSGRESCKVAVGCGLHTQATRRSLKWIRPHGSGRDLIRWVLACYADEEDWAVEDRARAGRLVSSSRTPSVEGRTPRNIRCFNATRVQVSCLTRQDPSPRRSRSAMVVVIPSLRSAKPHSGTDRSVGHRNNRAHDGRLVSVHFSHPGPTSGCARAANSRGAARRAGSWDGLL